MPGEISGLLQISTSRLAPAKGLVTTPGQVLRGRVLEVIGNRAVLLLNGLDVIAQTEAEMVPGEQVLLLCEGQKTDGSVLFKKMPLPGGETSLVTENEAGPILNYYGLRADKLNTQLLQLLVKEGLPLSAETVQYLSRALANNDLGTEFVPAAVWLWNNGLPLTQESIMAAYGLLQEGSPAPGSSPSLQPLLFSLTSLKQALLFDAVGDTENLAVYLQGLAKNLGLTHERDIFKLFIKQESTAPTSGQEQDQAHAAESLKSALMQLLTDGKESGAARENVAHALRDVVSLQLLNLAGHQETGSASIFVFGWLMPASEETVPFFLKTTRHSAAADSESDEAFQVWFFLATKHTGEVACRLALENNCLTCGLTVTGEKEKALLDSHLHLLRERMQQLPWKTVLYPVKVESGREISDAWHREILRGATAKRKTLDVRA